MQALTVGLWHTSAAAAGFVDLIVASRVDGLLGQAGLLGQCFARVDRVVAALGAQWFAVVK